METMRKLVRTLWICGIIRLHPDKNIKVCGLVRTPGSLNDNQ